jgi:ubiquinol-cytochrome c reductase cytochrome c subunit
MTHTILLACATAFVVVATPLPVASQTPPQPPASPASAANAGDAENGRRLYMTQTCYYCHGTVGQGAGRTGARLGPPSRALAGFIRYVRRPSGAMPAITDQVSDQDLTDIYAYLRTVPPAKNPKEIPLLNQLKAPGK